MPVRCSLAASSTSNAELAGRVSVALVVSSQRDLDIDGARLDGISRQDEEQRQSHLQGAYAPLRVVCSKIGSIHDAWVTSAQTSFCSQAWK